MVEAGMSQCSWRGMSCFSRWSGEHRDRHQVFAPELRQPCSCWAGWAQVPPKSSAPEVPGGSVELVPKSCRGRLLSYGMQGTLTQQVKQDRKNGGISLSFLFFGMGTVVVLPQVVQKCLEESNS